MTSKDIQLGKYYYSIWIQILIAFNTKYVANHRMNNKFQKVVKIPNLIFIHKM